MVAVEVAGLVICTGAREKELIVTGLTESGSVQYEVSEGLLFSATRLTVLVPDDSEIEMETCNSSPDGIEVVEMLLKENDV